MWRGGSSPLTSFLNFELVMAVDILNFTFKGEFNMITNKEKGRAGLSMAIAYYGCKNFTISLPLNDTQDYDLIIDDGKCLQKIQVKCTGYLRESGCFSVPLRSCGGTKGKVYKRATETSIDAIFVLCTNGWMFHIPLNQIKSKNAIAVGDSSTKSPYTKFMVSIPFVVPSEVHHRYHKRALKNACVDCGAPIEKRSTRCLPCERKRRIKVASTKSKCPPKEILLEDILNYPLAQVGSKYGVCSNTIRKWCKKLSLPYSNNLIQQLKK